MKSISVVKEAANISVRESKASFWNPCLETGQSVSETELSWRTGLSPILAQLRWYLKHTHAKHAGKRYTSMEGEQS